MRKFFYIHPDSLPEMIEAAIEKQGIRSQWVPEGYHMKKAYDITTDRVTIATIHSAAERLSRCWRQGVYVLYFDTKGPCLRLGP